MRRRAGRDEGDSEREAKTVSVNLDRGDWLDVLDGEGTWNVAQVLDIPTPSEVKVRYDGWGEEFDEVVKINGGRVAPYNTYTWSVKCWAKYMNWPWWPAIVTIRAPGNQAGIAYLATETRLFVDFLDRKKFSQRCRCWVEMDQVRPFPQYFDDRRRRTTGTGFEASLALALQSNAAERMPKFIKGSLPAQFQSTVADSVKKTKKSMGLDRWSTAFSNNRMRHGRVYVYKPQLHVYSDESDVGGDESESESDDRDIDLEFLDDDNIDAKPKPRPKSKLKSNRKAASTNYERGTGTRKQPPQRRTRSEKSKSHKKVKTEVRKVGAGATLVLLEEHVAKRAKKKKAEPLTDILADFNKVVAAATADSEKQIKVEKGSEPRDQVGKSLADILNESSNKEPKNHSRVDGVNPTTMEDMDLELVIESVDEDIAATSILDDPASTRAANEGLSNWKHRSAKDPTEDSAEEMALLGIEADGCGNELGASDSQDEEEEEEEEEIEELIPLNQLDDWDAVRTSSFLDDGIVDSDLTTKQDASSTDESNINKFNVPSSSGSLEGEETAPSALGAQSEQHQPSVAFHEAVSVPKITVSSGKGVTVAHEIFASPASEKSAPISVVKENIRAPNAPPNRVRKPPVAHVDRCIASTLAMLEVDNGDAAADSNTSTDSSKRRFTKTTASQTTLASKRPKPSVQTNKVIAAKDIVDGSVLHIAVTTEGSTSVSIAASCDYNAPSAKRRSRMAQAGSRVSHARGGKPRWHSNLWVLAPPKFEDSRRNSTAQDVYPFAADGVQPMAYQLQQGAVSVDTIDFPRNMQITQSPSSIEAFRSSDFSMDKWFKRTLYAQYLAK